MKLFEKKRIYCAVSYEKCHDKRTDKIYGPAKISEIAKLINLYQTTFRVISRNYGYEISRNIFNFVPVPVFAK
jgi:hypothetical protein